MGLSIDEARRALVDIARSMSRQKEDAVRRNERMRGKPLSYNINILGLGAIGRSVPGLLLEDILLEGYIDRINLMSHSPGMRIQGQKKRCGQFLMNMKISFSHILGFRQ